MARQKQRQRRGEGLRVGVGKPRGQRARLLCLSAAFVCSWLLRAAAAASPAIHILMIGSPQSFHDPIAKLSIKNKQDYAQRHGYGFSTQVLTCEADHKASRRSAVAAGAGRQLAQKRISTDVWVDCIWDRLGRIHRALLEMEDGAWLWSVDFDTIIMNPAIRLQAILDKAQTLPTVGEVDEATDGASSEQLLRQAALRGGGRSSLSAGLPEQGGLSLVAAAPGAAGLPPRDLVIAARCNITNLGSFMIRASSWSRAFMGQVMSSQHAPEGTFRRLCRYACPDQDAFDHWMRKPGNAPHVVMVPAQWINAMPSEREGNLCRSKRAAVVSWSLLVHFAGGKRAKVLFSKYWKKHDVTDSDTVKAVNA